MALRLSPADATVRDVLLGSVLSTVEATRELTALLGADPSERQPILERLCELERATDAATHDIVDVMRRSWVMAFDQTDIHALAAALELCVDGMELAGDLIVRYGLTDLPRAVNEQIATLSRMADLTAAALPRLPAPDELSPYWVEINRLENVANGLHRSACASLFSSYALGGVTMLQVREVLDALESAANAFELVAQRVEVVAVRNL